MVRASHFGDGAVLARRDFVRFTAGLAAGSLLVGSRARATPAMDSVGLIKARFVEGFERTRDRGVAESTSDLLAGQRPDGTWPDLDATASPPAGQSSFRPFPHVHRLRKLAGAYRKEGDLRRRGEIARSIGRGLRWWIDATPAAPYAWFREIGVPTQLAQMALLAEEILTPEERAGVVRLLRTSVQADGGLYYSGKPATGQNLIWEAHLQVIAACLTNDAACLEKYARRAEQEMEITLGEGVQPDYSFHQHGAQLYSGGYGQNFAEDCARLACVLRGTQFAFRPETVETLLRYVLDGQQWMIRGRHWDFGPIGRWIAWPEGTQVTSGWRTGFPGAVGLAEACRDLEPLAGARRDELRAFVARLEGRTSPETAAPTGCRVFWNSEYVSQVRPGYFVGVRMASRRVIGSETAASGQGTQNWHLGDGAMCLMQSGREYADIAPVWNWRRVPGVTCIQTPDVPLPMNVWGRGAEGGSDFAGGASDGMNGVAAMELARGGARARKAWFLLDDCVVCLGAGICADDPGVPLNTGVEQCWAATEARTSAGGAVPANGGTVSLSGASWVHHNQVTYLFDSGSEVRIRREQRRALWSTVNTFIHAPEPVSGEVFELWLEHGRPQPTASYRYVVAPGLAMDGIERFRRDRMPRIIRNDDDAQAIARGDGWQAVFWREGAIEFSGGWRLSADAPCAILARRESKTWTLAAGNPTHAVRTLRVGIEEKGGDRTKRVATFEFPEGAYSGRPRHQKIEVA